MRRNRLFHYALSFIVFLVCIFLVLPTLAIVPISFTSTNFIMFPPEGFSLRWYETFFTAGSWRSSTATSFLIAILVTITATIVGTATALGLRGVHPSVARPLMWFILLPIIVPSIIAAVAFYGAFSQLDLVGTITGLVIAHTVLALPFVVINVSAVNQKIDWRIVDAARSLGAGPFKAFRKVTLPAILPGVVAGSVFAFLTSFDEVVVAIFITGPGTITLPVQMWSGIRFEISPAVAAASTILLCISVFCLALFYLVNRQRA